MWWPHVTGWAVCRWVKPGLIVARARGVQPPGRGADQLGQPRLDVHVDVLELHPEGEGAGRDL